MTNRLQSGRALSNSLIVLSFIACFASAASFEQASRFVEQFAADGEVASFIRERHLPLRVAMAGLATVLLGSGIALRRWPQFITQTIHTLQLEAVQSLLQFRSMLRADWLLLSVITLVSGTVRWWYLDQPMRYDESYTYLQYASHPLYQAIAMYWDPNNHLFHTLQVNLLTQCFGVSPTVCRLPAWLAGTLLGPVCFLAMRRCGRGVAIVAGLMISLHPVLIEYSTTSRGYMLQALLATLLLRLTWTITRRHNLFLWACWIITAALALWTIPTSVYVVTGAAVWLLISGPESGPHRRQTIFALILTGLLTVSLYMPVFIYSGILAVTHNEFVRPLSLSQFVERWPDAMKVNWDYLFRDSHWSIAVLTLVSIGAAVRLSPERKSLRMMLGGVLLGTGLTLVQRVHPPARVWTYLIPFVLMLAAIGCDTIARCFTGERRQLLIMSLMAATMVLMPLGHSIQTDSILLSNEGGVFRDASAATQEIHRQRLPGEPIFAICPAHSPLVFYALSFGMEMEDFPNDFIQEAQWTSVLFVVNHLNGESTESLCADFQVSDFWRDGHVDELAKFPTGSLVRVTRQSVDSPILQE